MLGLRLIEHLSVVQWNNFIHLIGLYLLYKATPYSTPISKMAPKLNGCYSELASLVLMYTLVLTHENTPTFVARVLSGRTHARTPTHANIHLPL